jgi:predicted acyltransferase
MTQRFYSLDVFRGATVALMILVNNPGDWGHIYAPLEHAPWHGCTPTDLVFPFFLFAVGNAMAFVLPKLEAAGDGVFWKKVIKRTLLIFLIGLLLNWSPFITYNAEGNIVMKALDHLRFFGVLQRIALCYFFAAVLIHYLKLRGAFVAGAVILLLYWFLCIAANPSDPFSLTGWFGTGIDKKILGENHMYHGEGIAFDPEGLMSVFAAIVQVVFGYLAGSYIVAKGKTHEMLNGLFVAGCIMVFTGLAWDISFPVNKKIWTSSYTVYTTGLALLVLSVMIYIIEFKNRRGAWSRFFDVFGKNALFIFVLSGLLPRLLGLVRIPGTVSTDGVPHYLSPFSWFYTHICKPLFSDPRNSSLLYAICFITMMWFFAWLLDKKKIYIKV